MKKIYVFELLVLIPILFLLPITADAKKPVNGVPDQVTGLSATAVSTSQINLSWTTPSDGGSAITGYKIEQKDGPWSTIVANTGDTLTTYSVIGLNADTTYQYRVSAINAIGTGAASSTASATTLDSPTIPTVPLNLIATAGDSSVILNWDIPLSDGGEPISDYVIELSSDNGQTWNVYDDGVSIVTVTMIAELQNNHRYVFHVYAVNMVGDGPFAEIAVMPSGMSTTNNYDRPPPKIMGAGMYQIDTDNISDGYSKILLGLDVGDEGLFKQFVPYSLKSDKMDQESFGGFSNYEKRGQYLHLDENYIAPTFMGKVGKPIQIQIRLEDQFASTKIEHLSLYTANQNSDKSSAKIELNWNKGKPLSVIDQNKLLKTANAYSSLEDGFLWVVFDLVFEKEMKTSDIFLESWNEMRKPSIEILRDSFNIAKSDFIPKQRVSYRVDVDLSHDTSNPTCKASSTCFTPYNAKILKGGVVSWINNDSFMHDVESGKPGKLTNQFDFHIMPGDTLQKKFEKTGVFTYFCRLHPWATGVITVISDKQETTPIPTDTDKPVLLVASETSSGSVMVENRGTLIIPNKDLDIEISGHIQNKNKGQSLIITITKPDGTVEKLRASTIDKGYYIIVAKLDKKWQEGNYTVTTFHKNEEIASITFFVTDKEFDGFGGKLLDQRTAIERKISEYVNSSLSLDNLDYWMKENGYDQKDIEFIHNKISVFGLKK